MKRLALLLVTAIICLNSFAQDVITNFDTSTSRYVESKAQNVKGRLYQVKLTTYFTYVTIELYVTKNANRLNYWTSENTVVESGNAILPLLGALGQDNTYHSCTYNDGWGWNNVKAGERYYYTLIFSGRIPEGSTSFTLKDYAESGRGWGFSNYTIKNPKTHSLRDELYCRDNIDQNNDGICGIYDEIGGNKYRVACIKENGRYYLVYLGSHNDIPWWFEGDFKAFLEESATLGVFKAKWIMLNKTSDNDSYVAFDGTAMKIYVPTAQQQESTYMKMYPTASSNNGYGSGYGNGHGNGAVTDPVAAEWSGTGFALKDNYIVTNYHVVGEAKTIYVQGVNGDFTTRYNATVIATDKVNDLAILKVNGVNISNADIPYSIKTSTADVGEDVFVLGYPLTSTMGEELKLTTGVISSKTGFQGDVSIYQISAPIQPGNSGGPLFDGNGNIIGIVSAKHTDAENVSYAIKASYLRNLMESAITENILPQTNNISNYKLSDKVKSVRNFVYYITCSSKSSSSYNHKNSYNVGVQPR